MNAFSSIYQKKGRNKAEGLQPSSTEVKILAETTAMNYQIILCVCENQ